MKRLIRKVNNIFALIVLVVFYFIIIGLARIFAIIFSREKDTRNIDSYWKEKSKTRFPKDYFTSAY
jgi:hypothetical protein